MCHLIVTATQVLNTPFCASVELWLRGTEETAQDLLLSGWATLYTPESSALSVAPLLSEGYWAGVTRRSSAFAQSGPGLVYEVVPDVCFLRKISVRLTARAATVSASCPGPAFPRAEAGTFSYKRVQPSPVTAQDRNGADVAGPRGCRG